MVFVSAFGRAAVTNDRFRSYEEHIGSLSMPTSSLRETSKVKSVRLVLRGSAAQEGVAVGRCPIRFSAPRVVTHCQTKGLLGELIFEHVLCLSLHCGIKC